MTRILVVDDQDDIRRLVVTVLDLDGYDVVEASGGLAALARIEERRPDLVLLDVQMPEMDGWDTLEAIRARYGPWWPIVVLCTVKAHPRDVLRGWTLGCDAYLRKPFEINSLVDHVERALGAGEDERSRARAAGAAHARELLREYA